LFGQILALGVTIGRRRVKTGALQPIFGVVRLAIDLMLAETFPGGK
jgi:hypothetical protein